MAFNQLAILALGLDAFDWFNSSLFLKTESWAFLPHQLCNISVLLNVNLDKVNFAVKLITTFKIGLSMARTSR